MIEANGGGDCAVCVDAWWSTGSEPRNNNPWWTILFCTTQLYAIYWCTGMLLFSIGWAILCCLSAAATMAKQSLMSWSRLTAKQRCLLVCTLLALMTANNVTANLGTAEHFVTDGATGERYGTELQERLGVAGNSSNAEHGDSHPPCPLPAAVVEGAIGLIQQINDREPTSGTSWKTVACFASIWPASLSIHDDRSGTQLSDSLRHASLVSGQRPCEYDSHVERDWNPEISTIADQPQVVVCHPTAGIRCRVTERLPRHGMIAESHTTKTFADVHL